MKMKMKMKITKIDVTNKKFVPAYLFKESRCPNCHAIVKDEYVNALHDTDGFNIILVFECGTKELAYYLANPKRHEIEYACIKEGDKVMKKTNHKKEWGKQSVHMGDFIHWLEINGYWLRGVDEITRWGECMCMKCSKPHLTNGWSWVQTTSSLSVCDDQIKRDIPPKTPEEWDAWGK